MTKHESKNSLRRKKKSKNVLFLLTWRWGGVVRVRVALAAVLHLEAGKVPGHADDAVRLVQKDVGQHAPVAVHHDHLPVRSTKQHLERGKKRKERKVT